MYWSAVEQLSENHSYYREKLSLAHFCTWAHYCQMPKEGMEFRILSWNCSMMASLLFVKGAWPLYNEHLVVVNPK